MKRFFNIKSKRTFFSFATILTLTASILSQAILPLAARADSPQFNIFTPYVHTQTYNRDYYLLDVKNETKGTDWNFPVSADPGDVLVFYLYYHNGVVNTTANNTALRIALPSGQNSQHTVTGYLWADNATNATLSSPLTQSVQINLSSSQTLQYISGSAKWFPNQTDWRSDAPMSFPSGQSGEQLFSTGINIGSNEGCWEFSGAIIFKTKIGSYQPPSNNYDLTVAKTVRNLTGGQSGYFESVNAQNNDRVEFKIQINNTGNTTLNNVFVRDVLPSYLSYVSGTVRLDGSYASDQLLSGGINIGSLYSGGSRTITFEATITGYTGGSQTLTNYAYARADQVNEKNDSATVYISQQSSYLNLAKYVRNLTAGQTGLLASTNANPGDRVLFTVQISASSGNQVNNVRVWDSLPSGLTYVSGTARLDGVFVSDALVSNGINLGALVGNQTRTVTFETTVGPIALASQTLINYAYVTGDNVPQQSASAQVIISQITPSNPSATLTKKVVNLTSPNGTDTDNGASVGNTLQYTITLANNGPGILNNIKIMDVLPSYVTFQAADSNGSYNGSTNQVTWYNGNLANGTSLSFSYRVTVQAVPYNSYIIRNTASADAANLASINSNEVRTTVGGVKGTIIKVITGGNSLPRNLAVAGIISLWSIFILYILIEYAPAWRNLRFKFAVWKIRHKENLA